MRHSGGLGADGRTGVWLHVTASGVSGGGGARQRLPLALILPMADSGRSERPGRVPGAISVSAG